MSQYLVTIGGTYAKEPIAHSEDADFIWSMPMFDGEDDSNPADLTGREFSFEIFDLTGASLGVYEIGTGITVASNVVTVEIPLEDWADATEWKRNCKLTYKFKMVLANGTRQPLFSDTFTLVK